MGDGPTDEGRVYVPSSALPDTRIYEDLGDLAVDGETFSVRRSDDGALHYDWVTGPNDGYGFSIGPTCEERGEEHHVAAVRDFLAGIDPATGYLSYP